MSDPQGYDPYARDPHERWAPMSPTLWTTTSSPTSSRTWRLPELPPGGRGVQRDSGRADLAVGATPPPSLRTSLRWQIATVRPLPPEQPAEGPASPVSAQLVGVDAGDSDGHRLPLRDSSDRPRGDGGPSAAGRGRRASAAAYASGADRADRRRPRPGGGAGWLGVGAPQRQQNQQAAGVEINELLSAPDAKVYATTMNGAPVSFVVSKERTGPLPGPRCRGTGRRQGLPAVDDQREPDHSERADRRGGEVAQWLETGPLDGAKQLAVTIEPDGGSKTPTLPPVAGVEL